MFRRLPNAVNATRRWEKEHLWLYLLALGFNPRAVERASNTKLQLGKNAFDVPNYSAFHLVVRFLFTKLNKRRAKETFRKYTLPVVRPADPEFRKLCSSWLKEISSEKGSGVPHVGPSLFLSPAGRKFIHLMYRFARYVVVANLRKSSADSNILSLKAVHFNPGGDLHEANRRCRVARNELLKILLRKNYIIRKYKKTSQCLIKEIKQMKTEYAHLQQQLQKMETNDQNKKDRAERIQKVRSMWALIMETFTSLKKEMEIVDSVREGRVNQYVFDGNNVVVSVPRLLVDRVESGTQEVCTGNLYEDEKLNFLTVIQLLNEALRILRDERYQFDSENHLQPIVNMTKLQSKMLLNLKEVRLRIEKQLFILNESNSRRQKEWIMKWESSPGWSSFCNQDLDVGVLQAVSEAEKDCEDFIFSQNPGSDSDILDLLEISYKNSESATTVSSSLTPTRWISSKFSELSETSENEDLLTEKDLHIELDSGNGKEKPVPPKISKDGKDDFTLSESRENSEGHVTQTDAPVKKEDVLEKAREELAEEIVKMMTSESPQSSGGRGIALDDLISSLDFNPFLTRKQIPRTPENLLTEIRNSWRKAIQSEDLSDAELVSTEEIIDAPVDVSPAIQDKAAITLDGASSSSAVHNFDYPLSERKSQGSSAECIAQKQMISQISESLVWEETSGMLESESSEEVEDTVSGESFLEKTKQPPCMYVEKSLNTPCISSEDSSKMNILPSNHLLGLVNKDLQWNAPPVLSSDSCEVDDFGMLHETTPEEVNSGSPSKFVMSESGFDILDRVFIPDNTVNKGNSQTLRPNLDSPFSRYRTPKKSVFGEEQELHEMFIEDESLSYFSDLSFSSEEGERDDLCLSVERLKLDEEFTKIQSPVSLSDKNPSLSSLLAFSNHLEEVASNINEIPLDLISKLKDKEKLNEKLSTEEPPSSL